MRRAFLTLFSAVSLFLSLSLASPLAQGVCMHTALGDFSGQASARPVSYVQATTSPSARDLTLATGQVIGDPATRRLGPAPRSATQVVKPVTGAEAMRVSVYPRMDPVEAPTRSATARDATEVEEAGWGYGPLLITIVLMITIGVKRFRSGKP